jgi:hypothetical protein
MRQFVEIGLFWVLVLVAICVLARFPDSWPGRILFARQGPLPIRGQPRSRYLLRWSAYAAGWFAQAMFVLGIGWAALRLDSSLADTLFFRVFCMVVVPLLATAGLFGSLLALAAALWLRYVGAERRKRRPARAVPT